MEPLHVLVVVRDFEKPAHDADPECLRLIRAVSPRIKVKDGAALAFAESKGDNSRKTELDALLS
jgi:hypothetical protein